MRCLCALGLLAALLTVPTAFARADTPPIKHVFVIVLENENYRSTFGDGKSAPKVPYLARDLAGKGALLQNYFAIGHLSLDNYIAMISGQAPNPITQSDCLIFQDFLSLGKIADGQYFGAGCVYPKEVTTVADQLDAKGLTWKGYMEDMANGPPGQAKACRHPPIGAQDPTQSAKKGDQYAARHNPFVYFHSIIDDGRRCAANDVDLGQLGDDLKSAATTPTFSYITPNLCNDGHDEPCVDGRPGGMATADEWLSTHVPGILDSPAMRDNGLLVVTFDEAEAGGSTGDGSGCCAGQSPPTTPSPGATSPGPGGGRIGAVAISPFIEPGSVIRKSYNHYGFLRSVENLYSLPYLGYAGAQGTAAFGDELYNRTPKLSLAVKARRGKRVRHTKRRKLTLNIATGVASDVTLQGACGSSKRQTDDAGNLRVVFKRGPKRKGKCLVTAQRPSWQQASRSLRFR